MVSGRRRRYLDAELRALLSGLWIFQAPFLLDAAVEIFAPLMLMEPEADDTALDACRSRLPHLLHRLYRRGLLAAAHRTFQDGPLLVYRLLPTVRPYAEQSLPQPYSRADLTRMRQALQPILTFKARWMRAATWLFCIGAGLLAVLIASLIV